MIGQITAGIIIEERDKRHGFHSSPDLLQFLKHVPMGGIMSNGAWDDWRTMVDCVPANMSRWAETMAEEEYFAFIVRDGRRELLYVGGDDRVRGFQSIEDAKARLLELGVSV